MSERKDVVARLDEAIPEDVVSSRAGGGGKRLSYLEAWYVRDRLNQVIGHGNWGYELVELKAVDSFKDSKERFNVSAIARLRLDVKLPELEKGSWPATYEEVGYGNGVDRAAFGPAYELAFKEAASDALKRAAVNLGRSMGLALYDKEQTYVEKKKEVTKASGADKIYELISRASRVVVVQKKATVEELKAEMKQKYGVENKTDLSVEQAKEFADHLNELIGG